MKTLNKEQFAQKQKAHVVKRMKHDIKCLEHEIKLIEEDNFYLHLLKGKKIELKTTERYLELLTFHWGDWEAYTGLGEIFIVKDKK